jgi:hypothetical protein
MFEGAPSKAGTVGSFGPDLAVYPGDAFLL